MERGRGERRKRMYMNMRICTYIFSEDSQRLFAAVAESSRRHLLLIFVCMKYVSHLEGEHASKIQVVRAAVTRRPGGMAYWIEGHPILSFGHGATQK